VRIWDALPHAKFCNNLLRGYTPLGQIYTKDCRFRKKKKILWTFLASELRIPHDTRFGDNRFCTCPVGIALPWRWCILISSIAHAFYTFHVHTCGHTDVYSQVFDRDLSAGKLLEHNHYFNYVVNKTTAGAECHDVPTVVHLKYTMYACKFFTYYSSMAILVNIWFC